MELPRWAAGLGRALRVARRVGSVKRLVERGVRAVGASVVEGSERKKSLPWFFADQLFCVCLSFFSISKLLSLGDWCDFGWNMAVLKP